MKPPTLAIAGLLAAGAGGFYAGRLSSPPSQSPDPPSLATPTRATRESSTGTARDGARPPGREPASHAEKYAKSNGFSKYSKGNLDSIVRGEDAVERYRLMLSFVDGLAPGDFEAAVSEFRGMGLTEQRLGEYAMLLSAWAKVDPTGALAYAKENTKSRFATDTILASWASKDPDSAIRWAEENHQSEGANPYFAGIIRALAATDPARATGLLTSMPRSVERGVALDGILPTLLAQGNDATRAWIESLTDESLRNGAMLRVAEPFARTDPQGTMDWLLANPSEATQRRMDDVFRAWASKDEATAMSAYLALPAGETRSNALRGIVSNLAERDPQQAVALMDQHSADVSERMVRHFAWQTFLDHPQIAVDQIARVQDQDSRSWMYRRFVGSWIESDKAAATQWLQRNSGNDPVLQNLMQRAQEQSSNGS